MTDQLRFVGILLAAGKGARFDPAGVQDKLLQRLPDGALVVAASARHLIAATSSVHAVVRPAAHRVQATLEELGCSVSICPDAGQGMGASLAHALRQVQDADGWVIALGDMPYVRPSTITALVNAIQAGADIAVPACEGRRGNPVAFSRRHLDHLLASHGDQGARTLLQTQPVVEVALDDRGIFQDIDVAGDLDGITA
jgi:molybdenum cofactor cytidylyltransferase